MLLPGKTCTSNTYSKEVWEDLCRKHYSTITDPEGIHSAPPHSGVDLPKLLQGHKQRTEKKQIGAMAITPT